MRCLLETNAVIAFVGKTSASLVQRRRAERFDDVCLPSIVIYELAFGACRSGKVEYNLSKLRTLTRDMRVIDFTSDDARAAGAIRADLARAGTPIDKARGLCGVTHNTREFGRVAGLQIEDWTTR